ncbi:hypothetical protein LTR84_003179 [Exophiala bonariae]|uniref:Xylanolytic transcriptional activator regulatory domain-containing protein n=1 Tax=Exophiala bonariae TaxID=1690606 RepID=A0AAV9NAC3_9EURO|nr:hypothetical protein LTR84_003179 [Exophiala bonariae]
MESEHKTPLIWIPAGTKGKDEELVVSRFAIVLATSVGPGNEQKIDNIVGGIEDIKRLLHRKDVVAVNTLSSDIPESYPRPPKPPARVPETQPSSRPKEINTDWDTSHHIVEFVKAVVQNCDLQLPNLELGQAVSSLSAIITVTDDKVLDQHSDCGLLARYIPHVPPSLPPLKAAVDLLRWAKEHKHYILITHISRILPLEKFTEICQKVYFAVDGYNELEFILANGYLSYVSFEYFVASGNEEYNEYCNLCWRNLVKAFTRLPLVLPHSIESIAVLALGVSIPGNNCKVNTSDRYLSQTFNAIENSKSSLAWTFISYAANLCLTLGYHRNDTTTNNKSDLRINQESLFWLVYNLEKGLSLRLSRSSNIRDRDITLPVNSNALRRTRQAMIQGQVYDQLYSPSGLAKPEGERRTIASALAQGLREIIQDTHVDIMNAEQLDPNVDPMGIVYLRCDLVCTSSTLALILRAAPTEGKAESRASDDCIAVAREVMEIHQQCMNSVRNCKGNTAMLQKYINWAVLHTPFIPFSILFTQAVQHLDESDLSRIERFASSLKPEPPVSASPSHPYRIYELLSRTARLCVDSQIQRHAQSQPVLSSTEGRFSAAEDAGFGSQQDRCNPGVDALAGVDDLDLADIDFHVDGLSEWYYGNQQIMNLMDDDAMTWTY